MRKCLQYAPVEEISALDHKRVFVTLVVDEPEPRKLSRDWFAMVRGSKVQQPVLSEDTPPHVLVHVFDVPYTTFMIECNSSMVGNRSPLSWQYFIAPAQ